MSHSNSSLNTFATCMAKYEHNYIKHTPPCTPPNLHFKFGTMAHDVLHQAGILRDEISDGINTDEYKTVIPSEVLYPDLKQEFNISNWHQYFIPVIKETANYENEIIQQLLDETNEPVIIEREIKLSMSPEQLKNIGYDIDESIVGIIDCLIRTRTRAVILDYKFSTTRKGQDEFDMNSQLELYAFFVHHVYDIPLHNIEIGYIDIPKQQFGKPTILTNGTLSRSKAQNVSSEFYEKAVIAVHGEDDYYNCKPGGYYYEIWKALSLNKAAYLSKQYVDIEAYCYITDDLLNTAKMIDLFKETNLPFLKKYDSYSCKNCEYLYACKPWLKRGE